MRWLEVGLRAVKGYGEDRCAIFAAGVTYYALLSLFPLALVLVGALGFFVTDPADQARVVDELMKALPLTESGRGDLEGVVDGVVSARGALGLVGLVLTAWSASALFGAVRTALNGVFHVDRQRPFVLGKAVDLALVAGFGVLLATSFAMTVAIAVAQRHAEAFVGADVATLVAWLASVLYLVVPPLVTGLVFLLMFTRVANAELSVREVLPGVAVAALLFEVVKVGFAQYIASFGNYDATYGALGFVVVLLLFFNLASQVTLFGAEVARANAEVRRGDDPRESRALGAQLDRWRLHAGLAWLPRVRVPAPRPSVMARVVGAAGSVAPSGDGATSEEPVVVARDAGDGDGSVVGGPGEAAAGTGTGSKLVVATGLVALVAATLLRGRWRGED